MNVKKLLLGKISKNKIGGRIVSEYRYRIVFFAACSLIINVAYAIYHGVLGITQLSLWFITMWAYYMILGVARFFSVLCAYKSSPTSSTDMEYFVMRVSGIMLLILSFVLAGSIYISLSQNIAARYDKITMITIAAYTFTKIALSIRKAVQRHRFVSPTLTVLRNISFAEVAASVFSLQRSMIASFGEFEYSHVVDIITGAAVWLIIAALGIKMAIENRRDEKNGKIEISESKQKISGNSRGNI